MSNTDFIQRILFDDLDVRGVVAHLDSSYQEILERAEYPLVIQKLLGEMLAAVSLLSSTLKFEGRISLQAQGEGNLRLLMAQCNHHHDLRAIARLEGEVDSEAAFNEMWQNGRFVMTIEPEEGQRYQGVVPLESATLAGCIEAYFRQSEQLHTQVHLAADGARAAGFLLQVMPSAGTADQDWEHIATLGATLSTQELLELPTEEMLHRLYHEDKCRLFDQEPMQFKCDCSRQRSADALKLMTEKELMEMAQEQEGVLEISCHFCNEVYRFDTADIQALFSPKGTDDLSSTVH